MSSSFRTHSTAIQLGAAAVVYAATGLIWAITGPGYFWPRWVWFGIGAALIGELLLRLALRAPVGRYRWLALDRATVALLAAIDVAAWSLSGMGFFWPVWTIPAFLAAYTTHWWIVRRLPPSRERELTERVVDLTRTRRGALDGQAAELRRIERDLHDGAQARMVSLALNLGMAEDLIRRDPDAAVQLLGEARSTAVGALDDLRTVMQGIQPSVLADRGLVGGIRALVLDLAVRVTVSGELAPMPASIESALYFATAECLANVVKHSNAERGWVTLERTGALVTIVVGDDGTGGADPRRGSGLRGVMERLDAFDGRLRIDSPPRGPTLMAITATVPGEDLISD
jgi:signal transduction histidine kinase